MNIKQLSIIALTSLIGVANVCASDFWSQDFDKGMPKTFKTYDNDGTTLLAECYKNVSGTDGWIVGRTHENGYSALSMSQTGDETAQDNWLITEGVEIKSANAYLRWDAVSIYKHMKESYKVMVSTTDTNVESFTEIATINAESDVWNTHLESLAAYNGQTIYVAFVCNSTNKFILAVDNIAIGEINDEKLLVDDKTERFCGNVGTVNVNGSVINAGKTYDFKNIVATVKFDDGTGEQTLRSAVDEVFAINDRIEYSFDVPVEVGKNTEYTISGELEDGTLVDFVSDYVICSYFKRTMLVEKGTGTWCNSCPDGTVYAHFLKNRYKDELIYVSVHIRDVLECNYQHGVARWLTQVPLIIINRIDDDGVMGATEFKKSGKFNYEPFYEIAKRPTYVGLNASAEKDGDMVKIHADVEFAKDYNNADDIYRMCYAIYENKVYNANNTGYNQVNNCNFNTLSGEFYYMPSTVPASMMYYENVSREGSLSKTGVSSFGSTISNGDSYSFDYELAISDNVIDRDNISVVVYVMNTKTAEILNAAKIDLSDATTSIECVADVKDSSLNAYVANGLCKVSLADADAPYSVEVVSIDGRVLESMSNIPSDNTQIDLNHLSGFAIVKVRQGNETCVVKAVL
ncbi:MAG: choice-of-anchor J domain-containing protein [Muribaculaceae bacterium]|nr:choice-of-anchor J domain-containing protein [Muribaculaceae bacterium]